MKCACLVWVHVAWLGCCLCTSTDSESQGCGSRVWGCAELLKSRGLAGRLCFTTNSDSILLTPFLSESGVWSTFCSFPLPEDGEARRRLGGGLRGTASSGSNGSGFQACVNLHLSSVKIGDLPHIKHSVKIVICQLYTWPEKWHCILIMAGSNRRSIYMTGLEGSLHYQA